MKYVPMEVLTYQALAHYKISDKDDDASPNYYGYVDRDGNWYILRETIVPGADTYRFAKGSSNYPTNWAERANPLVITYDYYYNVF